MIGNQAGANGSLNGAMTAVFGLVVGILLGIILVVLGVVVSLISSGSQLPEASALFGVFGGVFLAGMILPTVNIPGGYLGGKKSAAPATSKPRSPPGKENGAGQRYSAQRREARAAPDERGCSGNEKRSLRTDWTPL